MQISKCSLCIRFWSKTFKNSVSTRACSGETKFHHRWWCDSKMHFLHLQTFPGAFHRFADMQTFVVQSRGEGPNGRTLYGNLRCLLWWSDSTHNLIQPGKKFLKESNVGHLQENQEWLECSPPSCISFSTCPWPFLKALCQANTWALESVWSLNCAASLCKISAGFMPSWARNLMMMHCAVEAWTSCSDILSRTNKCVCRGQ